MHQSLLKGQINIILIKLSKNILLKQYSTQIMFNQVLALPLIALLRVCKKVATPSSISHHQKHVRNTFRRNYCTADTYTYPLWTEYIAYWTNSNLRRTESKYLSEFFNFSTLDTNNASCQTLVNKKSKFAVEVAAFVVLILQIRCILGEALKINYRRSKYLGFSVFNSNTMGLFNLLLNCSPVFQYNCTNLNTTPQYEVSIFPIYITY